MMEVSLTVSLRVMNKMTTFARYREVRSHSNHKVYYVPKHYSLALVSRKFILLGNVVPIQKYKTRVVYKGITRDGEKCNEAKWNLIGGIQFKQENTNRLLKFILNLFHLLGKTQKEIYHSLVF